MEFISRETMMKQKAMKYGVLNEIIVDTLFKVPALKEMQEYGLCDTAPSLFLNGRSTSD